MPPPVSPGLQEVSESALRGEPDLIEALSSSVTRILTGCSLTVTLPEVLPRVAQRVALNRLVVMRSAPVDRAPPVILFQWSALAVGAAAPVHVFERGAQDAAFHEWQQPLDSGARLAVSLATANQFMRAFLSRLGLASLLIVPIMIDERRWGQVVFESTVPNCAWSGADVEVLTLVGAAIGASVTREHHRQSAQERSAQLARSDALTGVANRTILMERLRQAFATAQRGARPFAVLYLDLDGFKAINDSFGHRAGDLLLQEVAHRLQSATRQIDLVARLGGDEFAIVQSRLTDSASAGTLAEKLIEIVSVPYTVEGNELRVGASIGISIYDAEASGADVLLAQADQALYRAKHSGKGRYRFYSEQIDRETRTHLALADELRGALARRELAIYYQPQVELASGRIMGMEALLRWNHPKRGMILPEDFVPIAEKFGLMQQVGRWVLDEACAQMARWRSRQMPVPVVVINVALAQIRMGEQFVRDVMESVARHALEPADIELDVTERALASVTLAQSGALDELRRSGIGIAIDDFGAQYSSLDYVRTYQINRLKITRGMIAAADAEPGGIAMVRAILSLARELGVVVVADGVETETQRKLLIEAGARTQGQGLYYGRAVSAEESMTLLRTARMGPGEPEGVEDHPPEAR